MRNNIFIKLLCSIPIILLMLYFITFLGICLILFGVSIDIEHYIEATSNGKTQYYTYGGKLFFE